MYPSINDVVADDIKTNVEYLTPNFIMERHMMYEDIASDVVSRIFVIFPIANSKTVIEHKIDPLVNLFISLFNSMK